MSGFTEFLHALVENGDPTPGPTLHPLMGPNGAQVWTAGIRIDRRLPRSDDFITVTDLPDELVVPGRRWQLWHRAWRFSPVS
jgi:hypothetical protein